MVSTLESTNLETPVTPASSKLGNSSGIETTLPPLYTTPETDADKAENEAKTPQKVRRTSLCTLL
jgi:hypothetical protein